jgi:hypothetical protein
VAIQILWISTAVPSVVGPAQVATYTPLGFNIVPKVSKLIKPPTQLRIYTTGQVVQNLNSEQSNLNIWQLIQNVNSWPSKCKFFNSWQSHAEFKSFCCPTQRVRTPTVGSCSRVSALATNLYVIICRPEVHPVLTSPPIVVFRDGEIIHHFPHLLQLQI